MGAGTPLNLTLVRGGGESILFFSILSFFSDPRYEKNKIAIHGFWVRAGGGPIFFLLEHIVEKFLDRYEYLNFRFLSLSLF